MDRCSLTFNDRYFQHSWAKANRISTDDCNSHPTSLCQNVSVLWIRPFGTTESPFFYSFSLFFYLSVSLQISLLLYWLSHISVWMCLLWLRCFTVKRHTLLKLLQLSERLMSLKTLISLPHWLSQYHPVQDQWISLLLVCLIHGYILADGCSDTGLALALVKGACVLVVEIFEITSLFFIQFGIFRKFILLQLWINEDLCVWVLHLVPCSAF